MDLTIKEYVYAIKDELVKQLSSRSKVEVNRYTLSLTIRWSEWNFTITLDGLEKFYYDKLSIEEGASLIIADAKRELVTFVVCSK